MPVMSCYHVTFFLFSEEFGCTFLKYDVHRYLYIDCTSDVPIMCQYADQVYLVVAAQHIMSSGSQHFWVLVHFITMPCLWCQVTRLMSYSFNFQKDLAVQFQYDVHTHLYTDCHMYIFTSLYSSSLLYLVGHYLLFSITYTLMISL